MLMISHHEVNKPQHSTKNYKPTESEVYEENPAWLVRCPALLYMYLNFFFNPLDDWTVHEVPMALYVHLNRKKNAMLAT